MKILFVDDELYFMQPYVEALERIAHVCVINTAIEAIKEIKSNVAKNEYDCLVLDVMMPPPAGWEARTDHGLLTGVEVLKECQNEIVCVNLPVLVLTNHRLSEVRSRVDAIKLPKSLVLANAKLETPAFYAAKLVEELIKKRKAK